MDARIFEGVIRDSSVAVTVVDGDRAELPIVYANGAYREHNAAPQAGRLSFVDESLADNRQAVARIREAVRESKPCTVVVHTRTASGALSYSEIDIYPLQGDEGKLFAAIHRDVSQHIETEKRLRTTNKTLLRLALHDGLTGIYNRQFFDKMLEREWRIQARARGRLAILMMDIDDFKPYNDSCGHNAGDACLRAVAATLDATLRRGSDFVARYGGDEFVALLSGCEPDQVRSLAQLIRERVHDTTIFEPHADPRPPGAPPQRVTLSVGVALAQPRQGTSPQDALDCADQALYRAKAAGKDRVAVHDLTDSQSLGQDRSRGARPRSG